jgi:DNA replication and repair protein RecF
VALRSLTVRDFRNLVSQTLRIPAGPVAIVGPNGAGKTNLLESVAVLGTLVSFRHGPSSSWVRRGADGFLLAGELSRGETVVEVRQEARLSRAVVRRLFRGARRLSPAEYLDLFPVTVLSSHDRQLVWGGPEERRRLLDRLAFALHRETLLVVQRYRRALRQRNALLQRGGTPAAFEAFEHDLARLGARLIGLRHEALAALERALEGELSLLNWLLSRPNLRYNAPDGLGPADDVTMASRLHALLVQARRKEQARGHTLVGPHRHDVAISLGGAPAREILSAGQAKLLATACKLAAMTVSEQVRGGRSTVVFDDVDAELDAEVVHRVVARVTEGRQALLSSAHPEVLLPHLPDAALWQVRAGVVDVAAGGSEA